ncbi:MAG: peptidoglycan-binding protein [Alphaproteobacteria bacterium]|nr:peptidoglycan-binding protein [Alphaproteobacteria bacterium]
MDAFETLLKAQNWPLALAFPIRGLVVNQEALSGADPVKVSAGGTPPRLLKLKASPMTGADVSWLQERLARAGIDIEATGIFDAKTDQAVRAFQQNRDLKPDGVVGPVTRNALEDLSVIVPAIDVPEQPMPAVDPVVLEPYPVIIPAPRESDDKPAPATKPQDAHAPAPHDAHAPPAPAKPAPHGSDDDIRSRVAAEIQAHIDDFRKSVLADPMQTPTLLSRLLANGRAYVAAILSMLTLAFTESRDLLAWTNTSGGQNAPQLHAVQGPAKDVFQSLSSARDWATQTYIQLHNFAATIPNDWVFRLRVAALALIAYAVTRFARRRKAAPETVKATVKGAS